VPYNVADAAELAKQFVAPLGQRWRHIQAVAERTREIAAGLPADEREADRGRVAA
jgi:hypothetical protein